MHSLSILSLSVGVANAAVLSRRDNVISQSIRDSTYNLGFGKVNQLTTVNPGVTYWMSGGSTHNFQGNVNNYGTIIASQTDSLLLNLLAGGQTANCGGSDSKNGNLVNNVGALISLNDYGSYSASTYDWFLHTLDNKGSLQFCGRGDTGGSTYQLYCDLDCYNSGLIDFEQYNNNLGGSFVWRNTVVGPSATNNIYNNGAFRLLNVVHHNVQNVYGDGCWVIDEGAVLYLEDGTGVNQNPTQGPCFPNQKIFFTNAAQPAGRLQTIHMDTAVYSKNSDFGAQLFGFGAGKAIEFHETIKSNGGFSYANGILTVTFISNNKVNIKIGSGYDASKFYVARNSQNYNMAGYNAIFYNGNCPAQNVPGQCQVSLPKCGNPDNTPLPSTSSSVSSTIGLTSSSSTKSLPQVSTSSITAQSLTTSSSTTTTQPLISTSSSVARPSSSTSITSSSSISVTTSSSRTTSPSSMSTISSSSVVLSSSSSATISLSLSTSTILSSSASTTPSSTVPVSSVASSSGVSSSNTQVSSSPSVAVSSSNSVPVASPSSASSIMSSSVLVSSSTTNSISSAASVTQSSATTSATGSGPCANGSAPDSVYTTSNGDTFGICMRTDFQGGDFTNVGSISSPEACAESCSKTAGCIAGSFVLGSQVCYLKNSLNPATSNSGVDSVYKISSGNSISNSASATSTSSSPSATVSTSSTVQQTTIASVSTTSPITSAAGSTSPSTLTTVSTSTKSGVAGPCAGGAGPSSTYVAKNGDVYGICLKTDFNGNDITSVGSIANPEACAEACSKTPSCIAGSLVRAAQTCYLKNAKSTPSTNNDVDSVYKISSGSGASTTSSASITSSSISVSVSVSSTISTTPAPNSSTIVSASTKTSSAASTGICANGAAPASTYTASNGDTFGICLNTDFYGGDLVAVSSISDTSSCAEKCSQTSGCVAAALNLDAQVCYLKSSLNSASVNSAVDGIYKISSGSKVSSTSIVATSTASVNTISQALTSTTSSATSASSSGTVSSSAIATPTGICANGAGPSSTYVTSNGDVYGICLKTDFNGGDLTSINNIADASSCAEKCSQTPGCIAASLVLGGQTCYLKSVLNPPSVNNAVDSAYKISTGLGGSTTTSKAIASVRTSSATNTSSGFASTTAESCSCAQTVTVTVTAMPTTT